MSIKAIVVSGIALAMSSTLSAQAQKAQPELRGQKVKPAVDWLITPLEGRVVKGMPYSAEIVTESIQTLGDGNRIVHRSTSRVYRDSEGRVRREEDRASASPTIIITDPVARKSITLDSTNRTARETPGPSLFRYWIDGMPSQTYSAWTLRPFATISGFDFARGGSLGETYTTFLGRAGRGGVPGRDEYVEEPLPNRTIEGVVASGIRKTTTIPQGAIGNEQPIKTVSEEWTSVDLQVLVMTEVNDPRTGRTTYRLTNINRAEPDPALFKVPADYKLTGGRGRGGK